MLPALVSVLAAFLFSLYCFIFFPAWLLCIFCARPPIVPRILPLSSAGWILNLTLFDFFAAALRALLTCQGYTFPGDDPPSHVFSHAVLVRSDFSLGRPCYAPSSVTSLPNEWTFIRSGIFLYGLLGGFSGSCCIPSLSSFPCADALNAVIMRSPRPHPWRFSISSFPLRPPFRFPFSTAWPPPIRDAFHVSFKSFCPLSTLDFLDLTNSRL